MVFFQPILSLNAPKIRLKIIFATNIVPQIFNHVVVSIPLVDKYIGKNSGNAYCAA